MNKSNLKYINPFEMGTNEYNQSQGSTSTDQGGVLNGFITPLADFTYAENNPVQVNFFNNAPQEKLISNSKKKPLGWGEDGAQFLTFNRAPDWYIKEVSLKTLENKSAVEENEEFAPQASITKESDESLALLKEEAKEVPQKSITSSAKTVASKLPVAAAVVVKPVNIISKIGKEVGRAIFSLIWENIFGFGLENKRPLTKEEQADKEKQQKREDNKKIYWKNLAEISKPVPIAGAIKQEVVITNQLNGFNEEYAGVVDFRANIHEYHKANRLKKEIENKAHQIQLERQAKMVNNNKSGASKKAFGTRAGELLMGAENPSHFTKALG